MAARKSFTPEPGTGENAWIELGDKFKPNERKLVSTRPQSMFRPTRFVSPLGPLRFVLNGVLIPPGVEVQLEPHGVQMAHLGDLVVFEVWNEANTEEELELRVYGVTPPVGAGGVQGLAGFPGASGKAPER